MEGTNIVHSKLAQVCLSAMVALHIVAANADGGTFWREARPSLSGLGQAEALQVFRGEDLLKCSSRINSQFKSRKEMGVAGRGFSMSCESVHRPMKGELCAWSRSPFLGRETHEESPARKGPKTESESESEGIDRSGSSETSSEESHDSSPHTDCPWYAQNSDHSRCCETCRYFGIYKSESSPYVVHLNYLNDTDDGKWQTFFLGVCGADGYCCRRRCVQERMPTSVLVSDVNIQNQEDFLNATMWYEEWNLPTYCKCL